MLKPWLSYIVLAATALTASGETIEPHSLYRADIDRPLRDLVYHLRISPDRYEDINLSLYWNYADSTNYCRADISIPAVTAVDNTDAAPVDCRLYRTTASGETLLGSYSDVVTYSRGRDAAFSLVLTADSGGARLAFGDRHTVAGASIPFDLSIPTALCFKSDRRAALITHTLLTRSAEPRQKYTGEVDATADDKLSGLWCYLDRDSDPEKVVGGIDYDIALVADADGTYKIVYQGADAGNWHKGDIKGRLVPTGFENHYDLEWVDMSGYPHKRDTSADLLLNGSILRLNFPLLDTTIRLRRK